MSIKTVLCILGVDRWENDIQTAVEFCEAQGAHLTALMITIGGVPALTYEAASTMWLEEQQKEIDRLAEEAKAVKKNLERTALSFDVQQVYTEFAWADEDIAERALYADLVLVGAEAASNEDLQRRVIDGALFQSPTPILINPRMQAVAAAPKSVLVAWDSSDEVARATRQSMEFLQGCDAVYVTLVDPVAARFPNGEEPGSDIATFLARHGVKAQVDRISSGGRRVDEALRQHATDVAADMVVMGAYNHPRIQQRLFGGVTKSMLKDSRIPLFLSR
ncbi:universal stress protein [Rhizobium sp. P32RR-XVIII]|uniref:universal stress protein n=1 Tax=Rhizobium sp. P32RR-XVIII TaxID=2726738 RepID=UPI0014565C9E|nr:universal stress protein [Rhizobium sp. P32RR-XVIII]NLS08246.1 universal stress protein [Rhizobium sp. P32RR-XVIII]